MTEPKGVLAIWTSPDGNVIATTADFDRGSCGGYKLWEAQRYRAKNFIKGAAVKAFCSSTLTNCLDEYTFNQIADCMLRKGHKVTLRAVGYEGEIKDEIERG